MRASTRYDHACGLVNPNITLIYLEKSYHWAIPLGVESSPKKSVPGSGQSFTYLMLLLVIVGGLCWLIRAAGYDILALLFGGGAIRTFSHLILGMAATYWAIRYRGSGDQKGTALEQIPLMLLMISGLCWFLMGLGYDLITRLIGTGIMAAVAYLILGLASLYWIIPAYQRIVSQKII